jgi:hypothetical protein
VRKSSVGKMRSLIIPIWALLFVQTTMATQHFAGILVEDHDPIYPFFNGISNPSGPYSVNTGPFPMAYRNGISAPANNGTISVGPVTPLWPMLGIAIHVTDMAGPSHSLATMNDPALGDIVADLAHTGDLIPLTGYTRQTLPPQYAGEAALLDSVEATAAPFGFQPFDIYVVDTSAQPQSIQGGSLWTLSFSEEVGNLDGITSLSVTDVGVVPEPSGKFVLFIAGFGLSARRGRSATI